MMWITAKRIFRAGFLGFWRNGFVTLAAVLVMTVTLFVLGSLIFTGVILNSTLTELKDKVDMNVYFTTEAPEERIMELRDDVAALPSVVSAEYISRDEALARFRERPVPGEDHLRAVVAVDELHLRAMPEVEAAEG